MARPPYANPDLFEEDFDFEMDRRPAPSPEMIALLMKDAISQMYGKDEIDEKGCYGHSRYYFGYRISSSGKLYL